jgi:hypothetical protein
MSLYTGRSKLYSSLKDTRLKWEEARSGWRDAAGRQFEEAVWEPLEAQVQATLRALDLLIQVQVQLRNDCS